MTINHDILKTPIFSLAESAPDHTLANLRRAFVNGSIGSGKSSTASKLAAHSLRQMRPKSAGYVVAPKKSETADWIARAKEAGRHEDLIAFDAE